MLSLFVISHWPFTILKIICFIEVLLSELLVSMFICFLLNFIKNVNVSSFLPYIFLMAFLHRNTMDPIL